MVAYWAAHLADQRADQTADLWARMMVGWKAESTVGQMVDSTAEWKVAWTAVCLAELRAV